MRKPKNPLNAEPFQGVDLSKVAGGGVMVARPGFVGLKNIEKYSSRENAEKGVMMKHGRLVRWI